MVRLMNILYTYVYTYMYIYIRESNIYRRREQTQGGFNADRSIPTLDEYIEIRSQQEIWPAYAYSMGIASTPRIDHTHCGV